MLNEQAVQDIVKEVVAKLNLGTDTETGMGIFTDMNEAIAAAKKAQAILHRMSMDQREKIISAIRKKLWRMPKRWRAWASTKRAWAMSGIKY